MRSTENRPMKESNPLVSVIIPNYKEVLRKDFPDVYGGNYLEVILYEIDKIFNFSKLNFRGI